MNIYILSCVALAILSYNICIENMFMTRKIERHRVLLRLIDKMSCALHLRRRIATVMFITCLGVVSLPPPITFADSPITTCTELQNIANKVFAEAGV